MIIQNIGGSQGALPGVLAGNGTPVAAAPVTTAPVTVVANPPTQASSQPPSSEQLQSAVSKINRALQQANQSLEFSVDSNTKTPVVKMIDTQTGKVIQQYPSEQTLAIAESIDQYLNQHQLQQGTLLRQKA